MSLKDANDLLGLWEGCDWLSRCGMAESGARVVASWKEAAFEAARRDFEDYALDRANDILIDVRRKDRRVVGEWNGFAINIKPALESVIGRKLSPDATGGIVVAKRVVDKVLWILIHALKEEYYRDLADSTFFRSLAKWIELGHIPIAWESGEYPQGAAVIF